MDNEEKATAETNAAAQKNETVFGGRLVEALKEDGTKEEVRVRQIPLRDYDAAFLATANTDEIRLVTIAVGKPTEWLLGTDKSPAVTPDSFEELLRATRAVNKTFFSFFDRRLCAANELAVKVAPATNAVAAKSASSVSLPT